MAHKRRVGRNHHKGPRNQLGKARPTLLGRITIHGKGATVSTPEGTFPVARHGIREAMSGDEVQVSVVRSHASGEKVAYVQSVVTRATTTLLGTYDVAEPLGVVVPLDARLHHDFFVLPEDDCARRLGVGPGDVVAARILQYPTRSAAGVATIERRMGSTDDLDMNIEAILASHDIVPTFPEEVLRQAEGIRPDVPQALREDPTRVDLRDECVVTVDPTDARDFDDAVSARRLDGDGYEVGVHIADVTHYVAWGSPVDLEARRRTCSVYLADRVVPMLPERLCNDVCSLVPGEDRLTMSVRLVLDARGRVTSARAAQTAIRSHARLDYDTVDRLLAGQLAPDDLPCDGRDAEKVAQTLHVLDEVARLRLRVRAERGAVDFESREAKVTLDSQGHPTGVVVRRKTPATSLIEEAMLMANEAVATMLARADVPAAYRVHEPPSPDSLRDAVGVLRELDLIHGTDEADAVIAGSPAALRDVLARAQGRPGEYLANMLLLRAQQRAVYRPHNEGHYALGARAYCHFTSPIRRYPDDVVHRALKAYLAGRLDSREQHDVARVLPQLCRDCSDLERNADDAARQSQAVKMAELFAGRVGQRFSGVVTGCERYGLFVMLDDSCAEGLVPVRALGDEWFSYDERRMTLTGEESGTVWRPGRRIAVMVTGATPAKGQIDFALASDASRIKSSPTG